MSRPPAPIRVRAVAQRHIAEDEIGDTYARLRRGKLAVEVGRPNEYGGLVLKHPFNETDYQLVVSCVERIVAEKRNGNLPNLSSDLSTMHVPMNFVLPADDVHCLPTEYTALAA